MLKTFLLVKFTKNLIDTAFQYATALDGHRFGLSIAASVSGSRC